MEPEAYHEMAALEGKHWWYVGMRIITHHMLTAALDGRRDLRILDAGCGTGANLSALAAFGTAFGFDFSPLALTYAKKDHSGGLARASVDKMPYPDNCFDLVTSFDVIYAREIRDDQVALAEMARVLKPGGWALVRVPALPLLRGPHDEVVHGARRYTAGGLRLQLCRAGLAAVRLTYANSLLLPLVLASRTTQNIAVMLGARPGSDVGQSQGSAPRFMLGALKAEARWIGRGGSFPAGVSLMALARKP